MTKLFGFLTGLHADKLSLVRQPYRPFARNQIWREGRKAKVLLTKEDNHPHNKFWAQFSQQGEQIGIGLSSGN
jgi:hypothetical protein